MGEKGNKAAIGSIHVCSLKLTNTSASAQETKDDLSAEFVIRSLSRRSGAKERKEDKMRKLERKTKKKNHKTTGG